MRLGDFNASDIPISRKSVETAFRFCVDVRFGWFMVKEVVCFCDFKTTRKIMTNTYGNAGIATIGIQLVY